MRLVLTPRVLRIRQIPHNRPLLCARVNQAHNDYLQLLVETGLAGFSIAVIRRRSLIAEPTPEIAAS